MATHPTLLRFLLTMAAVVAVIACGGTGSAPSSGAAPQDDQASPSLNLIEGSATCSLLSQAEAESAFEQTFEPPVGSDDAGSGLCRYINVNGFGLDLEVDASSTAVDAFDAAMLESGPSAVEVSGIGERAFESMQGRRLVVFLSGGKLVTMYSGSRIDAETFRELARLVAGRL